MKRMISLYHRYPLFAFFLDCMALIAWSITIILLITVMAVVVAS